MEHLEKKKLNTLSLIIILAMAFIFSALKETRAQQEEDNDVVTLPKMVVVEQNDDGDSMGYKVKNAETVGPWQQRTLKDTPYSISVMPEEMIQNVVASSPDQLLKLNPLTQVNYQQTRAGNVPISLRGFRFNTATMEDGIRNSKGYGVFTEALERVEILAGLSGFLYGSGNVGGVVNYVTKRPTFERLNSITIGNNGGESYYMHGDFGGKIDENGKLAYRFNIMGQDGNTAIEYQNINRYLVSTALDWQTTDNIFLQGNASIGHSRVEGLPAFWSRRTGVAPIAVPDTEKLWTQKWTFSEINSKKAGLRGKWDISNRVILRAALNFIENEREWHSVNTYLSEDKISQVAKIQAPMKVEDIGGYGFLDIMAATGPVQHKITAGFYANSNKNKYHEDASVDITLTGDFNTNYPLYISKPSYSVGTQPWYTKTESFDKNWLIGDDITLNEQWSALVGLNHVTIAQQSYNTEGTKVEGSHYDKSKVTPSAAIVFKPKSWISTYASYMESLEKGTVVPTSSSVTYSNAGEALEPLTSEQYELGTKLDLGHMSFNLALFYIDKANEYDRTNTDETHTYVQDGREVHRGVEVTAAGKLTERLTIFGGMTFLDAEIEEAKDSSLENKAPLDVAERMAKLYAEYDMPFLNGLTVTGGIYYTGAFYADTLNTDKYPEVVTGDIGARYTTTWFKKPLTFRLNVTNVSNKSYWISNFYTGDPRIIAFSVQTKL